MMSVQVENILAGLPQEKIQLAVALREIIFATDKNLCDTVKWSRVTFTHKGNDIAFICSCPGKSYIELGFFKAVYLHDPDHLFSGKGKEIRRIKIIEADKIPVKQIQLWTLEAMKL